MYGRVLVAGRDMGIYEGEDEQGILDAYARDAGYQRYETMIENIPGDTSQVRVEDVGFVEGVYGDPHGEKARITASVLDGGTFEVYEAGEVPESMRADADGIEYDHVIVQISE